MFVILAFCKPLCNLSESDGAPQNGFYDEDGNYTARSVTVDYRDAWLESLPTDMGNVNVSEGGQAVSDGSDAQQEVDEQVGIFEQLLLSSVVAGPDGVLAACCLCHSQHCRTCK
jgi:hypothetical protein